MHQLPTFQTAMPAMATVHMTVLPVLRSAAGQDGRTWSATGQRLPVHQRVRHEDHQRCHVVRNSSTNTPLCQAHTRTRPKEDRLRTAEREISSINKPTGSRWWRLQTSEGFSQKLMSQLVLMPMGLFFCEWINSPYSLSKVGKQMQANISSNLNILHVDNT